MGGANIDAGVTALLAQDARAGFFGKMPARGDFLRENLPRDFTDSWDGWWQRGLVETQASAGNAWLEAWLEAPVWRFVLPPGLCGRQGVLGVWLPSVDKSGRYFPLTIAAVAAGDWAAHVGAMTAFLDAAEAAGRDALEFDLSPTALLERVQAGLAPGAAPEDGGTLAEPGLASWWTEGGPRVAPRHATGAALPTDDDFATLIDDAWAGSRPGAPVMISGILDPS